MPFVRVNRTARNYPWLGGGYNLPGSDYETDAEGTNHSSSSSSSSFSSESSSSSSISSESSFSSSSSSSLSSESSFSSSSSSSISSESSSSSSSLSSESSSSLSSESSSSSSLSSESSSSSSISGGGDIDLTSAQTMHIKCNDNAANTTVTDSVGTLTLTSDVNTDVITTAGKINNGFNLAAGTANHYALGGYSAALNTATGAIAVWAQKGNSTTSTISNFRNAATTTGFLFFFINYAPYQISLAYHGRAEMCTYNDTFTAGVWYHIVIQQTGSGIELYVDGVKKTWLTNDLGTKWISDAWASYSVFMFGAYRQTTFYGGFNSKLDDYRVFNRPLTQPEIDFLYNSGNGTEEDHN